MLKIVDGRIYRDGQKVGWIEGKKIKSENNITLGICGAEHVYASDGVRKIAYIKNDALHLENGQPGISLETVDEKVEGTYPLNVKCAVHVLLEE